MDYQVTFETNLYTSNKVAELLGLKRSTVSRLIFDGHFPHSFKLEGGRDWLIPHCDYEDFVETRRKPGRPKSKN